MDIKFKMFFWNSLGDELSHKYSWMASILAALTVGWFYVPKLFSLWTLSHSLGNIEISFNFCGFYDTIFHLFDIASYSDLQAAVKSGKLQNLLDKA